MSLFSLPSIGRIVPMLPEVEMNLCSLGIKLNLLLFDDGLRSGCGYIISHILMNCR